MLGAPAAPPDGLRGLVFCAFSRPDRLESMPPGGRKHSRGRLDNISSDASSDEKRFGQSGPTHGAPSGLTPPAQVPRTEHQMDTESTVVPVPAPPTVTNMADALQDINQSSAGARSNSAVSSSAQISRASSTISSSTNASYSPSRNVRALSSLNLREPAHMTRACHTLHAAQAGTPSRPTRDGISPPNAARILQKTTYLCTTMLLYAWCLQNLRAARPGTTLAPLHERPHDVPIDARSSRSAMQSPTKTSDEPMIWSGINPMAGKPLHGTRGQRITRVLEGAYYHNAHSCWTYQVIWDTDAETCERVDNFKDRSLIPRERSQHTPTPKADTSQQEKSQQEKTELDYQQFMQHVESLSGAGTPFTPGGRAAKAATRPIPPVQPEHTTTRTIVELSNQENTIKFTRGQVLGSIKIAARVYSDKDTPRLDDMVFDSYRETGPYKVAMHPSTAQLIVGNGAIEVTQTDADDPEEEMFDTYLCDDAGRRIQPSTRAEGRAERWERQEAKFSAEKASNQEKTVKFYLDLPSGASTWSEPRDKAFSMAVHDKLRELLPKAVKIAVEHLTDTDSGDKVNRKAAYIRFASKQDMLDAPIHTARYLAVDPLGLVACKPAKAVADARGVKPCCLLPRCRGPGTCTAFMEARAQQKALFGSLDADDMPPPWVVEKKRKIDERERARQERDEALDRAAQKLCSRYLLGACHRFNHLGRGKCSRLHGTAEEAVRVPCCSSREPRPTNNKGQPLTCDFTADTCPYGGHIDPEK